MSEFSLPQPFFFKVVSPSDPSIVIFVNAAHVARIEIDSATLKKGTLHLVDGTTVMFGANEADWIMRLMSVHFHEQMQIVNQQKRLAGERPE